MILIKYNCNNVEIIHPISRAYTHSEIVNKIF